MLPSAHALLICTDRDDTNVLITLTARHVSADVRIVARVEAAATYVMDLISAGGQVMLAEREPRPEEIGRRPVDVGHSLIVRVIRGAQAYSFWEQPATMQAGDKLIVLHSRAAASGA